jgi:hypothetical protein
MRQAHARHAPRVILLMAAPKFAYGRISLILLGFGPFSGETEFLD